MLRVSVRFFFEQSHDLWELKSSFISSSLLSIIRDGEQVSLD